MCACVWGGVGHYDCGTNEHERHRTGKPQRGPRLKSEVDKSVHQRRVNDLCVGRECDVSPLVFISIWQEEVPERERGTGAGASDTAAKEGYKNLIQSVAPRDRLS